MYWTWDDEKDRINRRKHGLPLSIGEVALADPLALSQPDPHPDGDRWNTLAVVAGVTLFIVHTWPDETWPDETWPDETWPDETWPDETWPDEMPGRIISVRVATKNERRAYENG